MPREYDKLVRDRTPEPVEDDGERPVVHTAEGSEYSRRLAEKLVGEATEFRESGAPEELADVLEVVHALRGVLELSESDLQRLRAQTAERRGRFERGVALERVEE